MTVEMTRKPRTIASPARQGKRSKRKSHSTMPPLRGLLPFVLGIGLWQLLGSDDSTFFPKPSTWVTEVTELAKTGELAESLAATAQTFILGLLIATVIGSVLGVLVGGIAWVDRMLGPILEFLRATPSSAKVPVAVLLLGYGSSMKLVVVVIATIWPVLLSTRSGVREMNPVLRDVARTLHLGTWQTIRKIIIPSLLASVMTGVRVSTPITLIVTLVVEIITQVNGLGGSLSTAQQYYNSSLAFGLVALTAALALLVNIGIAMINDRLFKHLR